MSPSGPGTGDACLYVSLVFLPSEECVNPSVMTYSVLHAVRAESLRCSLSLGGRGRRQEGNGNLNAAGRVQRLGVLLRDLGGRHRLHRRIPDQAGLRREWDARVSVGSVTSSAGIRSSVVRYAVHHRGDLGSCGRGSSNVSVQGCSDHASEGEAV